MGFCDKNKVRSFVSHQYEKHTDSKDFVQFMALNNVDNEVKKMVLDIKSFDYKFDQLNFDLIRMTRISYSLIDSFNLKYAQKDISNYLRNFGINNKMYLKLDGFSENEDCNCEACKNAFGIIVKNSHLPKLLQVHDAETDDLLIEINLNDNVKSILLTFVTNYYLKN